MSNRLVATKSQAIELKPDNGPLSSLTKEQATRWLTALGEQPRAKWTSVEIKSRITEILDMLSEEDNKLPKNMTSMKKADLQRECTERHIHFTEHETKGSLMRKIREQVEADKGGTGVSIMGFGKHSERTYEEVAENDPAYVKWARDTVEEEGMNSSAQLRKFVKWVNNKTTEKDKTPRTSARTESGRASSAGHRVKRMAAVFAEKGENDMKAETPIMEENPTPKNKVEEQIIGALEKLDRRMSSLETKQVKPDETEKHYPGTASGTASESWQDLSSDRGGK